jgi:hypothetical protein
MNSLLASKPWQAFTQRYWGVEPIEFHFAPGGPGGPELRMVCYHDRRGRLLLPLFQPHVPIEFRPTPTTAAYRDGRQWLETAQLLVDEMIARGIRGELTFSSLLTDPRPWLWSWFRVSPRFTYLVDLPFCYERADRVVRQQAAKAARAGFVCKRTDRLDDALRCLAASERRKGFSYRMTLAGLELAHSLLGAEALRVYAAYAADGEPAAARVLLHQPGGPACDWMAGTADRYLNSGTTQQLIAFAMEDLAQAGASAYDFCGADLPDFTYYKLLWGGRLATQYSIQAYDYRSMRRLLGNLLRYRQRQRAVRKSRKV